MPTRWSNLIGIDDAPFTRAVRRVALVGVVVSDARLDGVVCGHVQRDGRNATERLAELVLRSPFREHVQAVLLQGLTFGGFNVVDLGELHARLERPVLAVTRRRPDLAAIEQVLRDKVPGGLRKWRLLERAGAPEPLGGVFVHRAGLTRAEAESLLEQTRRHGKLPEPLRLAHLIAGAFVLGRSRGGA